MKSATNLILRPYSTELDDQTLIFRQWAQELLKSQTDLHNTKMYIERQNDMKHIDKYYDGINGQFFVALIDDKMIGFAGIKHDNVCSGSLMRVNIHTNYRKQGIASQICKFAIDWYHSRYPQHKLGVTVDKRNVESQALCKNLGFELECWYGRNIQYWKWRNKL